MLSLLRYDDRNAFSLFILPQQQSQFILRKRTNHGYVDSWFVAYTTCVYGSRQLRTAGSLMCTMFAEILPRGKDIH